MTTHSSEIPGCTAKNGPAEPDKESFSVVSIRVPSGKVVSYHCVGTCVSEMCPLHFVSLSIEHAYFLQLFVV